MAQPYTVTGGARVGGVNASWPLAKLAATNDRLELRVALLGRYTFSPEEVVSLERYARFLSRGIQISHVATTAPRQLIFWCPSPDSVLVNIREAGFTPRGTGAIEALHQGFPIRWSVAIAVVALWNLLFLADFLVGKGTPTLGPYSLVALAFVFLLSAGTLWTSKLQTLVLKEGRSVGEARPLLRLLALVSGLLFVGSSFAVFFDSFAPRH
jgi:hypothetical protein